MTFLGPFKTGALGHCLAEPFGKSSLGHSRHSKTECLNNENLLHRQHVLVRLKSVDLVQIVTLTDILQIYHNFLNAPRFLPGKRFQGPSILKYHSLWIVWVEGTFVSQLKRLNIAKHVNVFKKLRLCDKMWCMHLRLRRRQTRKEEGNTWNLENMVSIGRSGLGYTFTLTASLFQAAGKPSIKWRLHFSSR